MSTQLILPTSSCVVDVDDVDDVVVVVVVVIYTKLPQRVSVQRHTPKLLFARRKYLKKKKKQKQKMSRSKVETGSEHGEMSPQTSTP